MTTRRMTALVMTGALAAGAAALPAQAQAAQSVRGAILQVEQTLRQNKDFVYFLSHAGQLKTNAQIRTALPHIKVVAGLYRQAATTVSQASASTAGERTARTSWVRGARLAGEEYTLLYRAFTAKLAHNTNAAAMAGRQAVADAHSASAAINKADRLLGLPKGA